MSVPLDNVGIIQVPTPAFTPGRCGPGVPVAIVLHEVPDDLEMLDAEAINCDEDVPGCHVSYHYAVNKDGIIHQYVGVDDTAWSIGTGVCGVGAWTLPAVYPGIDPNCYTINIALPGGLGQTAEQCAYPDNYFTPEQLAALTNLLCALVMQYGISVDLLHIVPHVNELTEIDFPSLLAHIADCIAGGGPGGDVPAVVTCAAPLSPVVPGLSLLACLNGVPVTVDPGSVGAGAYSLVDCNGAPIPSGAAVATCADLAASALTLVDCNGLPIVDGDAIVKCSDLIAPCNMALPELLCPASALVVGIDANGCLVTLNNSVVNVVFGGQANDTITTIGNMTIGTVSSGSPSPAFDTVSGASAVLAWLTANFGGTWTVDILDNRILDDYLFTGVLPAIPAYTGLTGTSVWELTPGNPVVVPLTLTLTGGPINVCDLALASDVHNYSLVDCSGAPIPSGAAVVTCAELPVYHFVTCDGSSAVINGNLQTFHLCGSAPVAIPPAVATYVTNNLEGGNSNWNDASILYAAFIGNIPGCFDTNISGLGGSDPGTSTTDSFIFIPIDTTPFLAVAPTTPLTSMVLSVAVQDLTPSQYNWGYGLVIGGAIVPMVEANVLDVYLPPTAVTTLTTFTATPVNPLTIGDLLAGPLGIMVGFGDNGAATPTIAIDAIEADIQYVLPDGSFTVVIPDCVPGGVTPAARTFYYENSVTGATLTIAHNLNYDWPHIIVFDDKGYQLSPNQDYNIRVNDPNTVEFYINPGFALPYHIRISAI